MVVAKRIEARGTRARARYNHSTTNQPPKHPVARRRGQVSCFFGFQFVKVLACRDHFGDRGSDFRVMEEVVLVEEGVGGKVAAAAAGPAAKELLYTLTRNHPDDLMLSSLLPCRTSR